MARPLAAALCGLAPLMASLLPAVASGGGPGPCRRAAGTYERAKIEAFDRRNPAAALGLLQEAIGLCPEESRFQGLLGRVHELLENWLDSRTAYQRFLREVPAARRNPLATALAEAGIRRAEQHLGRISIEAAGARFQVDDREPQTAPGEAWVAPGRHHVRLEGSGQLAESLEEVEVLAGQTTVIHPRPRPPEPRPESPKPAAPPPIVVAPPPALRPGDRSIAPWIAGAAGLLLVGTGAALIAVDGRPYCDAPDPRRSCEEELSTQDGGGALVVLGGTALLTSAFVYLDGRRPAPVRPVAGVRPLLGLSF